jgi:hypothetical protein
LHQKVLFDWTSGCSLPDFEGKRISFPAGATHLGLGIGYLSLDFENYTSSFVATETVYLSPTAIGAVIIPATTLIEAEGIRVGVVLARFVQELNGEFYPLKNEKSVALEVVSVNLG